MRSASSSRSVAGVVLGARRERRPRRRSRVRDHASDASVCRQALRQRVPDAAQRLSEQRATALEVAAQQVLLAGLARELGGFVLARRAAPRVDERLGGVLAAAGVRQRLGLAHAQRLRALRAANCPCSSACAYSVRRAFERERG